MPKPHHLKNIKNIVRKQLKNTYPNFYHLSKNEKKEVLENTANAVMEEYDFHKEINASNNELLNIDEMPPKVITIKRMREIIKEKKQNIYQLFPYKAKQKIKDPELKVIYDMVDWNLINSFLSPSNYTPGKREILPVNFFRAELLKHLKYPEISYRKFDEREINNPERKENRAFIGIDSNKSITHHQLSDFRSSLSFSQLLNVMVYFIALFQEKHALSSSRFYALDSTELAAKVSPYTLYKIKIGNKAIRFYQDLDADTGMRRNKRDKSKYIVGYRLHTLTVVDAKEEKAYPLLSLLSPANHHDSNFLKPLVELGKAIGLELNIIAGDQAYGEVEETEALKQKHNVTILNTPKSLTKLPKYVDEKTFAVRKNADCSADMEYRGKDEEYGHEFHCGITFGQCPFEGNCNKIRHIEVDSGVFGQIPYLLEGAQKVVTMRKVAERPFNLIKHRDGLEPLRTKGRQNSMVVSTFANITTLLIEIVGLRKKKKQREKEGKQLQIVPPGRDAA